MASSKKKVQGAGDLVAAVTKKIGFRECAGCKKRREALNKWLPLKHGFKKVGPHEG